MCAANVVDLRRVNLDFRARHRNQADCSRSSPPPTMALNMPPATPQRPTPGAFINTPARPRSFAAAPLQQQQAPAPVESPMQRAGRTINSMIDRDNAYRSLEAYMMRTLAVCSLFYGFG